MHNLKKGATSARRTVAALATLLPGSLMGCGALPGDVGDEDVGGTTAALTQVINVSTVSQLYGAFRTAASSSNAIEVRLAPGTYFLTSPSSTDPGDTTNLSTGSLKVKRGNVTLIGASNLSGASSFVIDGGRNSGRRIPLLYVAGSGNPQPVVTVKGITFQNSSGPTARSPIHVNLGVLKMSNSVVFNTQTQGQGGGGLYANTKSNITLSRCLFSNNVLEGGLGSTRCGGFFDDGGALQISNSSAFIEYSTFISGIACRGGGIFISGTPSDTFSINQSTITNNEAKTRGGGLMIFGNPKVNLNFNTISSNTAGTQQVVVGNEAHIAGGLSVANTTTASGSLRLVGNIIAQNDVVHPLVNGSSSVDGTDCYLEGPSPSISAQNGNLIGERGNCGFISTGPLVGTHAAPVDAGLFSPTDMGGGIFPGSITVQPPLSGSRALHAYQPSGTNFCPSNDQLGMVRTSPCTIGSVEDAIF